MWQGRTGQSMVQTIFPYRVSAKICYNIIVFMSFAQEVINQ